MLGLVNYNPDVLSCLANLSNDEVFTPPNLANQMLDLLPPEIWSDPDATFLDPACKTGVFLREAAKRLDKGLEHQIPNLQKRMDHIFSNQLYGIAITDLTALLARRSVYCSKNANGDFSVCEEFNDPAGNIRYHRTEHSWQDGRCKYCKAAISEYERDESLESHAYEFTHTDDPESLFGMEFDVILGNPPYQLSDAGHGTSATPIYQDFVEQAIKLQPRYITMIIPARWYSGGKGLDTFRRKMLNDNSIRQIVDYPVADDCFSGVQIKGGVCYFLWDRKNPGLCKVSTFRGDRIVSEMERPLLEKGNEVFIRYNEAVSILQKVRGKGDPTFADRVSARKPFGLDTKFKGKKVPFDGSIKIYQNGGIGYAERDQIMRNEGLVNRFKVLIPRAGSGSDSFPHSILGQPFVAEPPSACSETYMVLGDYDTKHEADNVCQYVKTHFFRFMVLLMKSTQDATARVYRFVPAQDFSRTWSDEDLYAKYGLTDEEVDFIQSMIRPME